MYEKRILNIIDKLKENKLYQLIVTDMMSIFYLTGYKIDVGERIICLYINADGIVKLLVNKLFTIKNVNDYEVIYYSDNDDSIEILSKIINKNEKLGIDKNWSSGNLIKLSQYVKHFNFIDSSYIIDQLRLVKDENEKKLMKKSSIINDIVMEQVSKILKNGIKEIEVVEQIKKMYKDNGADDVSFEPIVSFGKNAANPHHEADNTITQNGDCVVIDIGCLKNNYASDMTRTFFIGEVSKKYEEIYNVVKEANLIGINTSKPGVRMCDVDSAVRNYIESKGYGEYFIHRTGHSIGLEDHEVGDVSASNLDVIKEGQIFSIEPGIYIPELNIGVRIEDLVLITKNGCEVLNKYTKDLIVIK